MREYKTVAGLLADPERWCKGAAAKLTRRGGSCPVDIGKMFCLLGAIHRVYKTNEKIGNIVYKVRELIGKDIITWNDARRRTHAQVLAVVKKARI